LVGGASLAAAGGGAAAALPTQTFDAAGGPMVCTSELGTTSGSGVTLHGVAPAAVAPGQPVSLTVDYTGPGQTFPARVSLRVPGGAADPSEATFEARGGDKGINVDLGVAGSTGAMHVALDRLEFAIQVPTPQPHAQTYQCTFTTSPLVVTIPINASATTTATVKSTATTWPTTGTSRPSTTVLSTATTGPTTTIARTTTTTAQEPWFVRFLRLLLCIFFGLCP
jgi:LysM repeat protein